MLERPPWSWRVLRPRFGAFPRLLPVLAPRQRVPALIWHLSSLYPVVM
jgi:hypothetical protein